ncbi:hypothetical protein [Botrimarina sp.]|uniref:hypothetical protein n=1 Tax=Botrimarina sp. TaxID=2795802 RepID=UPI0032EDBDF7
MSVTKQRFLSALAAALGAGAASAAIPYSPVPVHGPPVVGPGVIAPDYVYGKEYSHDRDFSTIGPTPDPQQVIAWDGGGGTADAMDYSGTRPAWEPDQQVDAIANTRDAMFDLLLRDAAHLTFSHDDLISGYGPMFGGGPGLLTVPSVGPVFLSGGAKIGGAGEISVEHGGAWGAPAPMDLWASAGEVNGMPTPVDVDGTELWGREPRPSEEPDAPVFGDADKYSLDTDFPSGVSVWNASGDPYVSHATIVDAVTTLLGPIPASAFSLRDESQGRQAINLDALLVSDTIEEGGFWHEDVGQRNGAPLRDQNGQPFDPVGPNGDERGDTLVFSIRQILDPADADGYYSTGSELFVLDSLGGVGFLKHGGHLWDHGFTLSELAYLGSEEQPFEGRAVIDINALEIIGEDQATPCRPGDFNCDGAVDAADYTVWRDSLGSTGFGLPADGDGDGDIDADDYGVWKSNYGAGGGAPASAVPEGSTAALALGALAAAAMRRR